MNHKNVLIRPNLMRRNTSQVLSQIIQKLREIEITPMISSSDSHALDESACCVVDDDSSLLEACDIIMTIGGDGTVLRAVHDAIKTDKPLIGVNAGRVGFLTQLESSELELLERLARDDYTVSGRMLLEAEFETKQGIITAVALNDIVMRREDTNHILSMNVHQGEQLVLTQRADGIIFATPTGSTAYSLSAGGPVVFPDMDACLLTPICSQGTFRCSLVLPPDRTYTVTETGMYELKGFAVSADGCFLGVCNKVEIRRSQKQIKLIDLGYRSFYQNLNDKLVRI